MEWHGKPITEKQVAQLLKGKRVAVKGLLAANNDKFDAAIFLDDKYELKFEKTVADPPADPFEKCPSCQQGKVLKGNAAFGCSRFKDNCKLRIPFELASKKLTDKQITELLLKGKTGVIKGFVSPKTGNKFDAALILQTEGNVTFQF
jgi:DNA topoisomerase-3